MTVSQLARGTTHFQSRQCAKTIIQAYLRYAEKTGLCCPEALAERRRVLTKFARTLADLPIAECKPFHLSDWIENHATWKSNSTRQGKANLVKACFNWAARQQRIAANPFLAVRYEEAEPRPPMADEDLERFLLHANTPFGQAVRFLRLTGCRLSDLCRIEWSNVDLEVGIVVLTQHKSRRRSRRHKTIVLVPQAVELLMELSNEQDGVREGPVFRNNQGKPWTRRSLGQTLRRLKTRTGIETPATLHGIRHQFGTVAVRQGAPIKLISLQMGHSSVAVTEKYYLHLDRDVESIREALKAALPRPRK